MRQIRERSEQLEEANRKLALMSYVDAVTEVANRRSFEEELKMEWRRSMRAKSSLSLLMADIDGFKAYNDALGSPGRRRIAEEGRRRHRRERRRAGDVVARYGGEEFADAAARHRQRRRGDPRRAHSRRGRGAEHLASEHGSAAA